MPRAFQRSFDRGIDPATRGVITPVPKRRRWTSFGDRLTFSMIGGGCAAPDLQCAAMLLETGVERRQRAVQPPARGTAGGPQAVAFRVENINADQRLAGCERRVKRGIVLQSLRSSRNQRRAGRASVTVCASRQCFGWLSAQT